MAKIVVIDGPDLGAEFDLAPGAEEIVIGRDPVAAVALSDPAVSRAHVRLEHSSGAWRVNDLASRNQTYLNGIPVRDGAIAHGDVIRAGDTEMRFVAPESARRTERPGSTITSAAAADATRPGATFIRRIDDLERMLKEEKARRALEEVRRLLEVYGRMAGTASATELVQGILDEVIPVVGATGAAVVVLEGETWSARARYPSDAPDAEAFSHAVVERAAATGEAMLVANPRDDEKLRESRSIAEAEITTAIAIPLVSGGSVRAVVYADRRGVEDSFGDEDLALLADSLTPAAPLLDRLLEEERLRDENRNLFRSLTETKRIIGQSPAIEQCLKFIERAAPTPMTVLIHGETGTGKELVASALHYASPRRGKPLVAINCAALPENLVESELFGHEKGAFTSAVSRRKGRFELAEGGTVFLDEIGELSLGCQAKLLRLLEERCFERVGGSESIQVDVRVVAATNRDLLAEVDAGRFREDLYYRLNVLAVEIPPLRERREDIPPLVDHFLLERCGAKKKLTKTAEKKLATYSWPGNVRQLRNVIESAVVLGEGDDIRPEDLILPAASPRRAGVGGAWEPISLSELEKQHIERVLEHTGGNKKRAAEILGIERCTLYSKLKSYAITPQ